MDRSELLSFQYVNTKSNERKICCLNPGCIKRCMKTQIPRPKSQNPTSQKIPKPKTQISKPETQPVKKSQNPKPKTQNLKPKKFWLNQPIKL